MPDTSAGTQFTELAATATTDDDRLAALYRYPDALDRCWVRANMIASIDGGATAGGTSGALGADGDRALFSLLRQAADVVVVGASTVRIENYSGVQLGAPARQARRERGQAEIPPVAVITRTGRLDRDAKLFDRTEVPPLILTSATAADDTRDRLGGVAEVIDASGADPDSVDLEAALRVLAERNLRRVLTEGGPGILGMFTAAGLLDELCLTVAPVLVGGEAQRIVTGPGHVRTALVRSHVLADGDGYLYCRYVRAT